jgi:uroporphyrinogen III methyltransferase/synthase
MKESEKACSDKHGSGGPITQPLKGKTVLITRPRTQSGEMTRYIEQLGATVIHCPTIEIAEPVSWAALDAAIEELATYDWLVFTSANGAEFFFRRLAEKRRDVAASINTVICAIGPATAKAIEKAGIRVDVIAEDSKAEGALATIIEHTGGEKKIRGLRFLIPRARIAREVLPVELSNLGAYVNAVEAYQTVKPDVQIDTIIRLFTEGAVDAITFTSSSTVSNFAALVGADDLSTLLQDTLVACIGPVTAATAIGHGITNVVQPDVYNATAMVEALVKAIESARAR